MVYTVDELEALMDSPDVDQNLVHDRLEAWQQHFKSEYHRVAELRRQHVSRSFFQRSR